jgi:hypothetical protein
MNTALPRQSPLHRPQSIAFGYAEPDNPFVRAPRINSEERSMILVSQHNVLDALNEIKEHGVLSSDVRLAIALSMLSRSLCATRPAKCCTASEVLTSPSFRSSRPVESWLHLTRDSAQPLATGSDSACSHNQSFRCGTYVIKGIAGDQS